MTSEKYFVYWVVGSTRAGDRNAGLGEFNTMDEAEREVESVFQDHPGTDTQAVLIRGVEVWTYRME